MDENLPEEVGGLLRAEDHDVTSVLSPKAANRETLLAMTRKLVESLDLDAVKGQLWLIEDDRVRIREA